LTAEASEVVEVQILDDSHPRFQNRIKPFQRNGSIFGVVPAQPGHGKPAGEWNREEIVYQGSHVRIVLNGAVIVDADLSKSSGRTLDGKAHPGLRRTSGYIGFAGHGSRVEFRNIRIKELTGANDHAGASRSLVTPGGWISLFDGTSLKGWKADQHPETWTVSQGAIVGRGQSNGSSHLLHEIDFADFVVETEVKINSRASSGFYFRAAQGDKFPEGYEVQIIAPGEGKGRHITGDLYGRAKMQTNVVKENTWFKLAVMARGNQISIALDDKLVLKYMDTQNSYRKGCFALQCWTPETVVHFRNLRVRPLQSRCHGPPFSAHSDGNPAASHGPAISSATGFLISIHESLSR
jgi:hypothetical protein